jgi:hypothetical protein
MFYGESNRRFNRVFFRKKDDIEAISNMDTLRTI